MARFENASEAIGYLSKHNVSVNTVDKTIKARGPGLKVLGAIDYLINEHKYVWVK